jgi:hypothetical protein
LGDLTDDGDLWLLLSGLLLISAFAALQIARK